MFSFVDDKRVNGGRTLYEFNFVSFVRLFYNNAYVNFTNSWFKISTDVIKTI